MITCDVLIPFGHQLVMLKIWDYDDKENRIRFVIIPIGITTPLEILDYFKKEAQTKKHEMLGYGDWDEGIPLSYYLSQYSDATCVNTVQLSMEDWLPLEDEDERDDPATV